MEGVCGDLPASPENEKSLRHFDNKVNNPHGEIWQKECSLTISAIFSNVNSRKEISASIIVRAWITTGFVST
jgi:hypothetical protein